MSGFITLPCNFLVDQPTLNNRFYPRVMMDAALREYMTNAVRAGELLSYAGEKFMESVNLSAASHIVQDVHLHEDGTINVDFKILDTPAGRLVEAILEEAPDSIVPNMIMSGQIRPHLNGMGEATSYSEVFDLKVVSIHLYCKPLTPQKI